MAALTYDGRMWGGGRSSGASVMEGGWSWGCLVLQRSPCISWSACWGHISVCHPPLWEWWSLFLPRNCFLLTDLGLGSPPELWAIVAHGSCWCHPSSAALLLCRNPHTQYSVRVSHVRSYLITFASCDEFRLWAHLDLAVCRFWQSVLSWWWL